MAMKANNQKETLWYYVGNTSLGIDPAPKGEWKDGTFILGEEDGPFKAGDKFLPRKEDLEDPMAFSDGTGVYDLDPV